MKRVVAAGLALAASLALPGISAEKEQAGLADRASWSRDTLRERVEPGEVASVRVRHALGDLRVEAVDDAVISIVAIAQRHRDDPRAPRVTSHIEGDQIELIIDFDPLDVEVKESFSPRRIDVGIALPKKLLLELSTGAGLLSVRKAEQKVRLRSEKGDLVYEGLGDVEASSSEGSIRARFYDTAKTESAELMTESGGIHVQLLEGAHGILELQTRGRIASDFSIEIEREPGALTKKGVIRLADEGARILVRSQRGDLFVEGLLAKEGTLPAD